MSTCYIVAPGEVDWYLGERCYRQLASPDRVVVLGPPPSVIESEGRVGKWEQGIPIDVFLLLEVDYSEWWATQTCGPLGGPVNEDVSSFV